MDKMNNQILYFINGDVPTNEEFEKASVFMNKGPFLEFISIQHLNLDEPLLKNVGVAGVVPDTYKDSKRLDITETITKSNKTKEVKE